MCTKRGTFIAKSLLDLPADTGNDVRGKNVSFSYSIDTQKETKERMQGGCWMKLKMTGAPSFKVVLSAVRIGFGFNAVLCGKGTEINSIMVAT